MLVTALKREKEEIFREGIEQGRAEGEELRNREIISAMLANGFDLSLIALLTELSVEDVVRLAEKFTQNESDGEEE